MDRRLDLCAVRARAGFFVLLAGLATLASGCGKDIPQTEVTIDSAPESGATVLVEGGVTAVTPATLRGLPEGQLNILLKMERYRDTEDEIRVEAGEPQKFVIEMEPLVGYLTIESEPSGAEVTLDDAVIGTTPIKKYAVGIGEHKYRLTYPNHYPYESEVLDVKTDHEYGVNTKVNLKPQEGILRLSSKPTAATIWLAGTLVINDWMTRRPSWPVAPVMAMVMGNSVSGVDPPQIAPYLRKRRTYKNVSVK